MDLNNENTSIAIGRIIARSINRTITPTEQAVLDEWLQDDAHRRAYAAIRNGQSISHALSEFDGFDVNEGYQRFQASIRKSKGIRYKAWMAAAAAVLVFLAASVAIYMATRNEKQSIGLASAEVGDFPPGGNRAMLTLADGRTITLDESRDGIVVGSSEITYSDGNPLTEVAGNEEDEEIPLLELRTPKGGTYQITLPDGTKVWLNAASGLKYPSRFEGAARVVQLDGEAYFDVSERVDEGIKIPFKVINSGQVVEVLGTQFNISAYPDDDIKTTLVAGRVKVMLSPLTPDSGLEKEVILAPGQQATLRGPNIDVQTVDVTQFTAWKEGLFYFDGTAPDMAFDQLERWYDIPVSYEGNISLIQFFGMIDRNKPLSAVLKSLENSGLRFRMEKSEGKEELIVVGE